MKYVNLCTALILWMSQIAFAKTDFALSAQADPALLENAPSNITLFLSKQGKGLGEEQLETVHTEKVHALIIDPTLTDYQHIHPKEGKKVGEYIFAFTPHTQNAYRIWLDITPKGGSQLYVMTDLPGANIKNPSVIKQLSMDSSVEDYHFKLKFDQPLKVGAHVMGSVIVTDKNGKPVTQLQPIMEAFAHIVAFNEDYKTILHIHPMGPEPKDPNLRGGPEIDFHIMPTAAGFVKLFVQVKIDGREIFVPFGFEVQ